MFEALSDRLSAALKKISGRGVLRPEDVDAGLREVRLALLEADVNFKVVKEFVDRVRNRLNGVEVAPGLTAPQQVVKAVDTELMQELKRLKAAVPVTETLLVADAMTGQEAVKVGEAFAAQIGLDGVILTKLDGDARGGAALSLRLATGQQIRFAGTGERPQDLEVFHAERMASRILGMGDVLSLVERAERSIDQEAAQEVESRMRSGHLTFDDFLVQVRQLRKMGSLDGILDMVPGGAALKGQVAATDTEREVRRMEAAILSMTPRERAHPAIIDRARRRRIARCSGPQPADVNKVLKARDAMQKLAKQFGVGNRGGKAGLGRLFGQGGSGWSR